MSFWTSLAKKYHIYPVYYVYNNKTIEELIEYLPLDKDELLDIYGINENKIERFGQEILSVILEYCKKQYEEEINKLVTIRERIKNYNNLESLEETFDDLTLIKLAVEKPSSLDELLDIEGFPEENIEIFGEYLIKQIKRL